MHVDPDDIEQLLGIARSARAATVALAGPTELPNQGAAVTFPVAVFAPGSQSERNHHYWSFRVSHEPGSVFAEGVTRVTYSGAVNSCRFDGHFHVAVGDVDPASVPPPGSTVTSRCRPVWAATLPRNQWAPAVPTDRLARLLARSARRRQPTADRLMAIARPFVEQIADGLRPQLHHRRSFLDYEDVVNEGWRRVIQIIDAFTGPGRPRVPWSTAIYRNCRRDMHRAVYVLDGTSEAVSNIRSACWAHPAVTDPTALQRIIVAEDEERRGARRCPSRPASDPRFTVRQIRWAMEAPQFVPWPHDRRGHGMRRPRGLNGTSSEKLLADVDEPAVVPARALCQATGVDAGAMLDVMADLGVSAGGDPAAARLTDVRRALLAPFILDGERDWSESVLRRAGRRARSKLFCGDDLLAMPRLREAWEAGITEDEARRVDAPA